MDPEQTLLAGADILSTYLVPLGFRFELSGTGNGSGGSFAYGCFINDDRVIEMHFRYSLGLISYRVGGWSLSHEQYIDLLGRHGENKYPGYSEDPLEAFSDLLYDLKYLLNDFTENNATLFCSKAPGKIAELEREREIRQLEDMKHYTGDMANIIKAREEFYHGNYDKVALIRQQLRHPELLTPVEEKLFEVNEKHLTKHNKRDT